MQLRLISLAGLIVMIALAWAISWDRKRFPWRTVGWGLALQFGLAALITQTKFGGWIFLAAQKAVDRINQCALEGAAMIFGPLANQPLLEAKFGMGQGFVFAITVTATIIVVSALSSLLYYWGILQRFVQGAAWVMRRAMRTSGSESLAAAANIFMGQTEAPLVIKPYLAGMTRSELLAVMVGGMASIAGGVAAAYASMGINAGHLLTASVMSAPAALMFAKIILPEKEASETAAEAPAKVEEGSINSLDALCRGASDGMILAINVMAMLVAFVAVVALANYLIALPQQQLGWNRPVTFQSLAGWLNAPFAWLMGIRASDCLAVGQVLGERIVLNEFIGYLSLAEMHRNGTIDSRSFAIATYALCGFANFASIAIQIGGIGTLVPGRRKDLAQLGLRAMVGGLLACYGTATIVSILL